MLSIFKDVLRYIPPASSMAAPTDTRATKRSRFEEDSATASPGGSSQDLFGEGYDSFASEEYEREWEIQCQQEAHDTFYEWQQADAHASRPTADDAVFVNDSCDEIVDERASRTADSDRGP